MSNIIISNINIVAARCLCGRQSAAEVPSGSILWRAKVCRRLPHFTSKKPPTFVSTDRHPTIRFVE